MAPLPKKISLDCLIFGLRYCSNPSFVISIVVFLIPYQSKTSNQKLLYFTRPFIPFIRAKLPWRKIVFGITEHGIPFLRSITFFHH